MDILPGPRELYVVIERCPSIRIREVSVKGEVSVLERCLSKERCP